MENLPREMEELARAASDIIARTSLDVIAALAILILGWIVAGWSRRTVDRALARMPRMDATLRPFLASSVRYALLAFTVVAVLAKFGVETTSIIAALGAIGLAIGLALQGTLQNIAAGVMLLLLRPFNVGDYVDAGGTAGTVDSIGLFVTELTTFDGIYLAVPNSQLWNCPILNYSRLPARRLDVAVGVSYDDDIETGLAVLLDMMRADERVRAEPEPKSMVMTLGDSAVTLNMRCWVAAADYWPMRFEYQHRVKQALEAAGLSIPFPQRDVHIRSAPPAAPPELAVAHGE